MRVIRRSVQPCTTQNPTTHISGTAIGQHPANTRPTPGPSRSPRQLRAALTWDNDHLGHAFAAPHFPGASSAAGPGVVTLTDTTVLDIGVQDTGPDGARWALSNRGVDVSGLSGNELVMVWTIRGRSTCSCRRETGRCWSKTRLGRRRCGPCSADPVPSFLTARSPACGGRVSPARTSGSTSSFGPRRRLQQRDQGAGRTAGGIPAGVLSGIDLDG